eukprot:5173052-Pyramimonas_sp.AAC.1
MCIRDSFSVRVLDACARCGVRAVVEKRRDSRPWQWQLLAKQLKRLKYVRLRCRLEEADRPRPQHRELRVG